MGNEKEEEEGTGIRGRTVEGDGGETEDEEAEGRGDGGRGVTWYGGRFEV